MVELANLLLIASVAAELSIGVAPLDALGIAEGDGAELRLVIERFVAEERPDLELAASGDLDRALDGEAEEQESPQGCLRDAACASRAARAAGVDQLLITSAAALGRTYVLRLELLDARRGVIEREVQGTVIGGVADLRQALPDQLERVLPARPRPWYRRWWVWTTVGVVAAAGVAVGVTLALVLPAGSDMDTYPLP